ncbi:hypothetical protein BGW38_006202 [Lunasporangiospora selenospora]|uniref:Gag1-like clamp domain-containing protein n=1 Tax=Lunasporangiospora selenospora TaxID=979761 RepID=A0A9P6FMG7_9FUNG|nr:hypothetical protein BGW38_006202 [Lunasporangiospora selenospora]
MADSQPPAHATTDDESGSNPQAPNPVSQHQKSATLAHSKSLSPDLGLSTKTTTTTLTVPSTSRPQSKATAQKPSWATGDPFFDNMAGMEESSEYQQYYQSLLDSRPSPLSQQGSQNLTGLEMATASILLSADKESDPMAPLSSTESPATTESSSNNPNTGLDHWNQTREKWTLGRWQAVPSPNSSNPALSAFNDKNLDLIYDSLIFDRKKLSKPIPLPLVVKVLVSGWKRDGFWEETPVPPPTLSGKGAVDGGWGPGPSRAVSQGSPLPQGVNAHVPGFSSTHSNPIQRKL